MVVKEDAVLRFVSSALFRRIFQEGMAMVEDSAAYLDGPGREDSKGLARHVALAYAGESMRLTTRLMQVASWLLVQKAIADEEMTPSEAGEEKYRLGGQKINDAEPIDGAEDLPQRLRDLLEQSEKLYERVARVDISLYQQPDEVVVQSVVNQRLDMLRSAFPSV